MQTVSFELPDAVVAMLDQLCLANHTLKSALFKELVVRYIEDIEDGVAAKQALLEMQDESPWHTLEDIMREHALDSLSE
jgi:predicted DNA-binding protein